MRRATIVCALLAPLACSTPAPPAPVSPASPSSPIVPYAPVAPPRDPDAAPVAARHPHDVTAPAGRRDDPYYWLRDDTRKDPDVLAYLNAENAYTARQLAPAKPLEETLFEELKSRVADDDSSVPTYEDGYWYYRKVVAGGQQPIYARKKGTAAGPTGAEEVLLDGNAMAKGHDYFAIGAYDVSRDGKLIAWTDDTVGRRQYVLHVAEIATHKALAVTAENVASSVVWANDNQTVFYGGKDPTTLREDRVFRVSLADTRPALAFQEPDGSYYVDVSATKSHRYVAITASATTNSEVRLVDADKPTAEPKVFLPRQPNVLYDVDHVDGRFYVRTNDHAKNFRIAVVADGKQGDPKAWKDVIPHKDDAYVESMAAYKTFIAASVRTGGLRKVEVVPQKGAAYFLDAPDPTYSMSVDDTPDADAKVVRFQYDSLTQPSSIYDTDVATRKRTLLKQTPVPGYDATKYKSEYLHATAADGTKIPISVVYKQGTKLDGTAPILIYAYGSYGFSTDPYFSSSAVSLMDRGWVYAIAHVRGGAEMGRGWYEAGKLMNKRNTFTDFVDVTQYLTEYKYGSSTKVFAEGGSAGGLTMGAVLNLRPDLYKGVAALVPFVDVVTTMLDDSIPLTTNEYDEWGNPHDADAYKYMLSYSPYDNVKATAYPAIFVHTGLWDSQVQYYEPTKWVAKLRATKTDKNLLVLDIDMTSGHGGASGRFDRLRQTAKMLAFFLFVDGDAK